MKGRYFYFLLILCVLLADRSTKFIVDHSINLYRRITVIPGFLNLTHIRNRGAIFGFFSHSGEKIVYILLTIASLLALSLVVYYFFKTPPTEKTMKISLSLILGGALGNLVDRMFKGYVIDFVDIYIKKWHWPSFNVADASITIGALLLVSIILKGRSKCSQS